MEDLKSKKLPPHETRYSDLNGVVSIKLDDQKDFNALGADLAGYDPAKYQAVALRVYIEKTPVVTLYAIDKERKMREGNERILPVKKFKMEMTFDDLFFKLRHVNFTVTTGEYDIEEMEVINK